MKKQLSPSAAAIAIISVVVVAGLLVYMRAGTGEPQYGAKIPEAVLKEFREKGPRPMTPPPMPGGGTAPLQSGATGVPAEAKVTK